MKVIVLNYAHLIFAFAWCPQNVCFSAKLVRAWHPHMLSSESAIYRTPITQYLYYRRLAKFECMSSKWKNNVLQPSWMCPKTWYFGRTRRCITSRRSRQPMSMPPWSSPPSSIPSSNDYHTMPIRFHTDSFSYFSKSRQFNNRMQRKPKTDNTRYSGQAASYVYVSNPNYEMR
jgi:hypothetical protein